MIRCASLFSGIGGLDRGVEQGLAALGHRSRVIWQAEKDPYARAVLRKNWPTVPCYEDVHDIDGTAETPDVLDGGFPCQDLSIAGKRAGIDGARSGLWSENVRIIRVLRPGVVFVENVPELLRYLGRVLGPLAELGYDAEWDLFDAAAVGAPHLRERLFVLAYLPDAARLRREGGERGGAQAQHAGAARPRGARAVAHADGHGQLQPDASGEQLRQQGRGAKARTEPARPPAWPPEPDVGRVVDGPRSRLDGSRRRARLRCLGNGVVPQQARLAFLTLAARAGLRVACECKEDEQVIAEPDGYKWTTPKDGPCRGCELARMLPGLRTCPLHQEASHG